MFGASPVRAYGQMRGIAFRKVIFLSTTLFFLPPVPCDCLALKRIRNGRKARQWNGKNHGQQWNLRGRGPLSFVPSPHHPQLLNVSLSNLYHVLDTYSFRVPILLRHNNTSYIRHCCNNRCVFKPSRNLWASVRFHAPEGERGGGKGKGREAS